MSTPLYIHLPPCGPLPHLRPEPFKALLVVENIVPEMWRNEVCEWLAQVGCRSFIAWGQDSHQWQGAMNQTSSNIFGSGLAKDERVMTNARENETLADAIAAAEIATRQYAKRQANWFRHQFNSNWTLEERYTGAQRPHAESGVAAFVKGLS